jgi:hypothetical protein
MTEIQQNQRQFLRAGRNDKNKDFVKQARNYSHKAGSNGPAFFTITACIKNCSNQIKWLEREQKGYEKAPGRCFMPDDSGFLSND